MHAKKRRRFAPVLSGIALVLASGLPMLWHARQLATTASQAATPPDTQAGADQNAQISTTEIVVDARDDASPADLAQLGALANVTLQPNSIEARRNKLMRATLAPGADMEQTLRILRADPRVEAAEPDVRVASPEIGLTEGLESEHSRELSKFKSSDATQETHGIGSRFFLNQGDRPNAKSSSPKLRGWKPNDPRFNEQWNLHMVGAGRAWERTRGKGIVVAVIDTGVAAKSTDRGKRARDFNKTKFVAGYDFVHDDDDPYDDNGHGTHVSGTIAESTNNREGVAGLAPEAVIMPIKVLSAEGWGSAADVADAIRFAADNGAHIINLSLGSSYASEVEAKAVKYAQRKGVLIVCAAGNGFGSPVGYPAAFPSCVAVSSVGPSGELAFYSSYGPQVALAAPGGDLFASPDGGILQNTVLNEEWGGSGDDYYQFQGTSMASPHVAAAAALVMSQGVRDPSRVRDILLRSARRANGPRLQYGAGILSASRATTVVARQRWAVTLKDLLWSLFVLPLLWSRKRTGWAERAMSEVWWMRGLMALAFYIGAFGPDWMAGFVGADSWLNLLAFSALAPFLLFFELEEKRNTRIVSALALGVAVCLVGSLWGGALSPFTATAWGWTTLPWTLLNLCAVLIIAGVAWKRAEAK